MHQEQGVVLEQRMRTSWRSLFTASCLPRAERALRAAEPVVEAIDSVEGIDGSWESVMDALLAVAVPEMRGAIEDYYRGREGAKGLADYDPEVIARLDARLASFVKRVEALPDQAAMEAAIVMARAG